MALQYTTCFLRIYFQCGVFPSALKDVVLNFLLTLYNLEVSSSPAVEHYHVRIPSLINRSSVYHESVTRTGGSAFVKDGVVATTQQRESYPHLDRVRAAHLDIFIRRLLVSGNWAISRSGIDRQVSDTLYCHLCFYLSFIKMICK